MLGWMVACACCALRTTRFGLCSWIVAAQSHCLAASIIQWSAWVYSRPALATWLSKKRVVAIDWQCMYSAPVITSVFCQLLCPLSSTSLLGLPNVPKALTFWTFTEETSRYIAKMMLLNNYRSSVAILEQLVILEGQYCQP